MPGMPTEFLLCKRPNQPGFTLYQGRFRPIDGSIQEPAVVLSTFTKDNQQFLAPDTVQKFSRAEEALANSGSYLKEVPPADFHNEEDRHYTKLVRDGVAAIRAGEMEKVVLARRKTFSMELPPLGLVLDLLAAQNPGSFVYLLHSKAFGVWIGATPELLLSVRGERLETMALAGTARAGAFDFTPKDEDEHRIVAEEIVDILIEEGLKDVRIDGPHEHAAGILVHLMSRIEAGAAPSDPLRLANRLHPTSAVSGYPRKKAMAFIRENEGLERSLYSGFIGVVGPGEAACYVNLRCGQVWKNSVSLYAGAGIIDQSVPEDELVETQTKMGVLARVLGLKT